MIYISINKFELKLTSFLQEKNQLNLIEGECIFSKTASSLKRNIININKYLPQGKCFVIEGNNILNTLTYKDYIHFVQSISINDYISSQSERISLMAVYSFLNLFLNMTKLYQELGMSLTTKKKDSKKLTDFITNKQLAIELLPKKGVRIIGEETAYIILISSIIAPLSEVDSSDSLISRKANNPLEKMIYDYFQTKAYEEINDAKKSLTTFINDNKLRMSYSSKKFLYIYLTLSKFRKNRGFLLEKENCINFNIHNYKVLDHSTNETFLNVLISSLDFTSKISIPLDNSLKEITDALICEIQKNIITRFYSHDSLFEEIYCYLYKSIIRNRYNYNFYDNKLDDTHKEFSNLFSIVNKAISLVEKNVKIILTRSQISTLTLIFRKFIMENKIIARNSKNVIIVTNSAVEKTSFFIETLRHNLDITVVGNININELHEIKNLDYDFIITFSNRIATLLEDKNYICIKLNFYLHQNDIQMLLNLGFSSNSRRKILSNVFLEEISNKSIEEIRALLLEKYSSHFL